MWVDQASTFILLPAAVSMIPGLWACFQKRYLLGVILAVIGFPLIGGLALICLIIGLAAPGQFPAEAIVWSSLALYLVVSTAIVMFVKPKRIEVGDSTPSV